LVQIIDDSAKCGYAILQNLADWSRSQTGMTVVNPEELELKALVDENIKTLKLLSTRKDINISSDINGGVLIYADKNMINAVLRNLISNAVKFTHNSGHIGISAIVNSNEVTVCVKDNGIGIPEQNLGEVFRVDSRFSRPGTRMEQGTGLGLKICKEFVEMLGGRIWVESTVHKGSEFKFTVRTSEGQKKGAE
jgi:two-component system sensor histidine kinase/response regulator